MNNSDIENAAYYLEIVMLDYLSKHQYISKEEYERILHMIRKDRGMIYADAIR